MNSLQNDIKAQADWIIKAFREDGFKLDYSIGSLKLLDKFFDTHSHNGEAIPGGRLSQNLGYIVFSIGSYLGETIIKNLPGAVWKVDDKDPEGEVNAEVQLIDGGIIWPMQRTMKRFKNGAEDSLFVYGDIITKDRPGLSAMPQNSTPITPQGQIKKPWWKFW
jgi:hypothetical protein